MLWSIIVGGIIGWLAGKLMNSKGGILRNIILGIVGSGVGNCWLALSGWWPRTRWARSSSAWAAPAWCC